MSAERLGLQTSGAGGAAPALMLSDASDPRGLKNFISFDVAHRIYPQGNSVDPNQDIARDMAANADLRGPQINLQAQFGALKFGYIWTQLTSAELGNLRIVGELMDRVIAHLA